MSFFRSFSQNSNLPTDSLTKEEKFSVYYHNAFNFPLTFPELLKWTAKNPPEIKGKIGYKNGFYYIKGRERIIYKRITKNRYSKTKIDMAKKASGLISLLPGIRMVGLTGSLAMDNADMGSDIDLLIITKRGHLWSTRFLTYLLLKIANFNLRKPGSPAENDKLCLNMWLDESDLVWPKKDRNFYTAHEILQIVPLSDKNSTYNLFLTKNKWTLDFWPNAVDIKRHDSTLYTKLNKLSLIEKILFKAQFLYMRSKITREVVTPTRAIFHPNDLSGKITKKAS